MQLDWKALAEARCVVVAWSEASIHSEWVSEEAEDGKERNILVPVFRGNVRPPMGFRAIQGATLVDWNGRLDDQSFQQLLNAVADILGSVESTSEDSLQSMSPQPIVGTPPVDLHAAETTPAPTAAQSAETPGDAQAGQLRGTSRDRGHQWLWIGRFVATCAIRGMGIRDPSQTGNRRRTAGVGERVDPEAQQESVRPTGHTGPKAGGATDTPCDGRDPGRFFQHGFGRLRSGLPPTRRKSRAPSKHQALRARPLRSHLCRVRCVCISHRPEAS